MLEFIKDGNEYAILVFDDKYRYTLDLLLLAERGEKT